jgi:GDP-L-fucose synthase
MPPVGPWARRRILVTGGAGFLGRAVVARLRATGARHAVVARRSEHDLTRADDVAKLFAEAAPELVVHLAARVGGIGANLRNPAALYLDNLLMGTYVIEEARRREVAKTIVLGTICSYPKFTPVPFREESLWDGYPEESNAPYGLAKKSLLVHAQANRAEYGQNVIYLLPTNLYGPGDKFHPSVSHVIPALIKRCADAAGSGQPTVEVWGTGAATREFLYVEDAAEGIVAAAQHYDEGDPVNLGANSEISIGDLARTIAELVGFEGDLRFDPSKPDGQPRRRVDATRARHAFGFEARTPLRAGLAKTIAWYREHRREAESPPRP